MKLDSQDVEAIAKSRVSRTEGNIPLYWAGGAMIAAFAGVLILRYSAIGGVLVALAGIGAFLWYNNGMTKRQNKAKSVLLSEWRAETKQEAKQ